MTKMLFITFHHFNRFNRTKKYGYIYECTKPVKSFLEMFKLSNDILNFKIFSRSVVTVYSELSKLKLDVNKSSEFLRFESNADNFPIGYFNHHFGSSLKCL